ncbi:MAG: hypothetical protein IH986_10950 [Planctomycetes bacterium]|nr:hypothetical protein [Planctomycetota bacterium]
MIANASFFRTQTGMTLALILSVSGPRALAGVNYIAGVPDWDQPVLVIPSLPGGPNGPWGAWCVPTATANIAGYYEDVWNVTGNLPNFPHVADGLVFPATTPPGMFNWQDFTATLGGGPFSPFRDDFGWYYNTHGMSTRAGGTGTFPGPWSGTRLVDIERGSTGSHGLVGANGYFPFRGMNSITVRNYGADTMAPGVFVGYDNTGDPQPVHTTGAALAEIVSDIRNDLPLLGHFEHFNLVNRVRHDDEPGQSPDYFPDIDEYDVAEWGQATNGDPNSGEQWDPDEGLGHTVTIVGYWDAADPGNPFYGQGVNAIVVHDNTDGYLMSAGQPLPLVLPWDNSPWMGLTRLAGLIATAPMGDLNCDGVLNGADINPFFLALGNPTMYATRFPNCDPMNGDINRDGRLDGADINPFFVCLGGGPCP